MKIVNKVEEGMNPKEILCTTYQMRDFYKQMKDGFFSDLDVMNYIQHHKISKMVRKGWEVIDFCCGRSLMLPLLRYHGNTIKSYTGVDICESNIKHGYKDKLEYPFETNFIIENIAEVKSKLIPNRYDMVIYTSSIEHMQKEAGIKSLEVAYYCLKDDGMMFISCPNTFDKKDPYDTQYAAHLYEWDLKELTDELNRIGFSIEKTWGLTVKTRQFEKWGEDKPEIMKEYHLLREYLPREWIAPYIAIKYPEIACEVAMIAYKRILA